MKNKLFTLLVLLVAFSATALAQTVIPVVNGQNYIEDFESGTLGDWTVQATGAGTWGVLNNTAAFQNAAVGDEARLISPIFDMSGIGGATFSFGYAMMGLYPPYDELTVSYRTSTTDDWHNLGNYSVNDWSNFFEASFELPDISSTYQISFLGHCNGSYYILVDNIEITPAMGCARPLNLQATDITTVSALLHWSTTGNEESWIVDINGTQKTADVQPYLIEGLHPQTEYSFTVKAFCSEGMESDWSNPATFKTPCDVIVVTDDEPYYDDFEASEEFICWQDEISSGNYGWAIDPGYLILNNTANFFWMGEEALLYSAPLDITAVSNPILRFNHKQPINTIVADYLYVAYRTSPTDSWHVIGTYVDITNDWETETLVLPETSATLQVGFDAIANNGEGNGVYVDNVYVGNDDGVGIVETPAIVALVNPNPATDKVTIEASVNTGEVIVFDLFGKQVTKAALHNGRVELDLSGFAQGVYMARIMSDKGMITKKLIKE